MSRFWFLLPILTGCPEIVVDEGDKTPKDSGEALDSGDSGVDADQDGYGVDEDCDDADPTVHPDAAEVCDGVDQDCNGKTDDAPVDGGEWFADGDNDGFGDASARKTGCTQPAGYITDNTDCNDDDAAYYPGAPEAACDIDSPDYNCNGQPDVVDADTDGFDACADCDDTQATVFPGNPESCDGLDNDCSGTIDDGVGDGTIFFADRDGDNFGDPFSPVSACAAPPNYVDNDQDCDDGQSGTFPGASEYCNSNDDNCNGQVDEASAVDVRTWYRDGDADGYGNSAVTAAACAAPVGYVADSSDCADGNAGVYPGAAEYCGGTDYDCDGAGNELDSVDVLPYYYDADADGYEGSVAGYACLLPSGFSWASPDCDDRDDAINPAADDVCDASDNDCDGDIDDGRRVPYDYSTISAAISAARAGESVCVAAGNYYEDIDFGGRNITVEGDGSASTYIIGTGAGSVVRIDSNERTVALSGFTITGGESAQGAGLLVYNTSPMLDDLVITQNYCRTASYCEGTGMYVYGTPTLTNVTVDSNYAEPTGSTYLQVNGAGAYISGGGGTYSGLNITNNWGDISATASSGVVYAAGLYMQSSYAYLEDLYVFGNICYRYGSTANTYAYAYGCGIVTQSGGASFDGVTDYFNQAYLTGTYDYVYGAGWYSYNDYSTVEHAKIVKNTGDAYAIFGPAWYGYYYAATAFSNSIIAGNHAGYYWTPDSAYGTIFEDYLASPSFTNVDIVGNKLNATYAYGGGLYAGYLANATFVNSSIYGNTLSGSNSAGGAIMGYGSTDGGVISFEYSNIYGNTATEFYNIASPVGANGNFASSAGYSDTSSTDASLWNLTLTATSAMRDAGDPAILDADGSRSDVGAYGGPKGNW